MAAAPSAIDRAADKDKCALAESIASGLDLIFNELEAGRTFLSKSNSPLVVCTLWMLLYRLVRTCSFSVNREQSCSCF